MKIALITFSEPGARIALSLLKSMKEADIYLHKNVETQVPGATTFRTVMDLTAEIFTQYRGLVYVAPAGLVVRAIAPHLKNKHVDPAVVILDVNARFAISLLGGHEAGGNRLAVGIANHLGAEPVISTTTEAAKGIIVGIGCRRGTPSDAIIQAVKEGLEEAGHPLEQVRLLASADIKADEEGLLAAAETLDIPIRFIPSDEIQSTTRSFTTSTFVEQKTGLPAVAELAALLAGRRTTLVLQRKVYCGVTIAIARESFLS